MSLRDKRVLVTGAAAGLGLAIAERFASEGAAVSLNDLSQSDVCEIADRLVRSGCRAAAVIGDVSITEDAKRIVAKAVETFGGLDILVNNAGIVLPPTSVTTATDEEWERVFAVNVHGICRMCRFAIPEIMKSGSGAIINIASASAFIATPNSSAYCASKAAVVQLSRTMAIDYAPNIRVNSICPGPIDTPLLRRLFTRYNPDSPDESRRAYERMTLLKRIARAEEVANCVVFLASDEASYVTGHAFVVDGGASLQWSGSPAEEVESAATARAK